jgi:uncharacterized protein (DUF1330 family)
MAVYVVGQLTIHDRERYDRYATRFLSVLAGYGGRLLAADEAPQVVEGEWGHQKVVLLEFPGRGSFERFAGSPEYREIAVDRVAATDGVMLLARGVR